MDHAAATSPVPAFWAANETCVHCGDGDFAPDFSSRTLLFCDCCRDRCTHVGCHQAATGRALSEDSVHAPAFEWFCSEARAAAETGRGRAGEMVQQSSKCLLPHTSPPDHPPGTTLRPAAQACRRIGRRLVQLTGVRRPLPGGGNWSTELVRYSEGDPGGWVGGWGSSAEQPPHPPTHPQTPPRLHRHRPPAPCPFLGPVAMARVIASALEVFRSAFGEPCLLAALAQPPPPPCSTRYLLQ